MSIVIESVSKEVRLVLDGARYVVSEFVNGKLASSYRSCVDELSARRLFHQVVNSDCPRCGDSHWAERAMSSLAANEQGKRTGQAAEGEQT